MNKIIIRMINNTLDKIETITTNENVKLFLMALDVDAKIINSEVVENEIRLTVEIDDDVYNMLDEEEDKIMDIIGLEVNHNGELTDGWKVV